MEEKIKTPLFTNQELLLLAVPLIVEQLLNAVVGLVDTMMVSHIGEAAVSGISLVDSLNMLIVNLFAALATGGAVVIGQYLGREDRERSHRSVEQLYVVVSALSLVMMMLLYVGKNLIISVVFGDIAPDVRHYTETYYVYIVASFPFIALYNCGAAVFRTMGNSAISMLTAMGMNVIHLLGNWLLIGRLGVAGAGISTLFSRICAAVFFTLLLCNGKLTVHFPRNFHFRIQGEYAKKILLIGIPSGIENSIFHLGKILIVGLVASFGTTAIAINAVVHAVSNFHYPPVNAVGLALLTVASRCAGRGDYSQVRAYTKKLLSGSYLLVAVYNGLFLLLTPLLLRQYDLSAEGLHLAFTILFWDNMFSIFVRPIGFGLPNTLRAAGDVRFTMTMSILVMWIARVGLAYVFGYFGLGLLGVWIAQWCDYTARAVAVYLRYRGTRWQKKVI